MSSEVSEANGASQMRVGEGYDIHALADGRKLVLGGVAIDETRGPVGHSDGDALAHAVCDALLGAAALGDIGGHFPPGDKRFKDAPSRMFLERAIELLTEHGYSLVNVDATVILEKPRLSPHIEAIRASLAAALGCGIEAVSVKAKTAEKLGPVGRGDAIEARAVALIERKPGG